MTAEMWVRRVLASAAVLVLGACWSVFQDRVPGHAQLASMATAEPPGFPDLSRFTQVDVEQFVQGHHDNSKGVLFRPPSEKFGCSFRFEIEPASAAALGCYGAIPGVEQVPLSDPEGGDCETARFDVGGGADGIIRRWRASCQRIGPLGAVLPPGQKIVYGSITCVEGENDLTACVIKDAGAAGAGHGFVISQQKTWTF